MSKKLIGILMVPVAVVAVAGGAVFITHQASAQSPQSTQQSTDKPEPGDTPDTPGKSDQQDKQDKQGKPDDQANGQDSETND